MAATLALRSPLAARAARAARFAAAALVALSLPLLGLVGPAPAPRAEAAGCVDGAIANPDALTASVLSVNSATGHRAALHGIDDLASSGSTMKLITALTAMTVLGPDYRIPTYLYPGTEPRSVVLVGNGDPTLRRGWFSMYEGASTVLALANSAKAYGATKASFDPWALSGEWHPGWSRAEIGAGYMAPMTAIMLDGGRADPMQLVSPRQADPAWAAGVAFAGLANAAFAPTIRVRPGSAPIGQVDSPSVRTMVNQMLRDSDNLLAEALARQVALKLGKGGSWSSTEPAALQTLRSLGLDPGAAGLWASDGSGLSNASRITPRYMEAILWHLQFASGPAGEIRGMLTGNRQAGSLASRLTSLPVGAVRAKTGWVDYGYGLAGFMTIPNGQVVRFAAYVTKPGGGPFVTTRNRNALDGIVEAIYRCS